MTNMQKTGRGSHNWRGNLERKKKEQDNGINGEQINKNRKTSLNIESCHIGDPLVVARWWSLLKVGIVTIDLLLLEMIEVLMRCQRRLIRVVES